MHQMKFEDKRKALEELGVSFAKPKHPEFSLVAKRYGSFSEWRYHQSPDSLARAGFYYTGPDDRVKCFFCGNILGQWEKDDDPWKEHAQWFPDCPFLVQCMGKGFVSEIQQIVAQQKSAQDPRHKIDTPNFQQYKEQRGVVTSPSSPECSLQSTVAIKCIQMGYPELTVRKAINIWQTRHGSRSFSLTDLVNVILDLRTSDSGYNSLEDLSNEENLNVGDSSESGSESVTSSENSLVNDEKVKNIDRTSVESEKLQENRHISAENVECSNDATKNHIENEKDSGYDSDSDDESESISDTEILQAENAELRERLFCRVCKDNTVSVIFLPCAHMCTCAQCYPAMKECPICTSRVKAVVKAFLV